jgi:glycosyltransferase involved in cell wall biosynthesis
MANSQPTICIVTPSDPAYSETFIRAHIERLPGKPVVLGIDWKYNYRHSQHRIVPFPGWMILRGMRALARQPGTLGKVSEGLVRMTEILAVGAFLRRHRVDVVLAEYGMIGAEVMDACMHAKIPLVVHFHGYDAYNEHAISPYYRTTYRRMFLYAAALIAVSHDMEQQLTRLGAPAEKIVYGPYGVDPTLFARVHPEVSAPRFLAVGRFVDKKAPYLTILAFSKVVQAYPAAQLIMVGNGPLYEACQQLIQSLGLAQSVSLLGVQSHAAVASHMKQARAFVQHSVRTSYGDSEGTPVAVLEAGMSGLPVVSTRHAGIKDVVIEGETGFLVDESDIDGMAMHMLALAQNADLAGQMGQRAREHVAANFPMERHIEQLYDVLRQA